MLIAMGYSLELERYINRITALLCGLESYPVASFLGDINNFHQRKDRLYPLLVKFYDKYIKNNFSNWFVKIDNETIFEIAFRWFSLQELQEFFPEISLTTEEGFDVLDSKLPLKSALAWLIAYVESKRIHVENSRDLTVEASDFFKKNFQLKKEQSEEEFYEVLDIIKFADESPMRWMLLNKFEKEALDYFDYLYINGGEKLKSFYHSHCIDLAIRHNHTNFLTGVFNRFSEDDKHEKAIFYFHDFIRSLNSLSDDSCLKHVWNTLPTKTKLEFIQKDLSQYEHYPQGSLLDFMTGLTKKTPRALEPGQVSYHFVEKLIFSEQLPIEVKNAWLKSKAYKHAESNRTHKFVISSVDGVTGDTLKAQILNQFDDQLRECTTLEEINTLTQDIKSETNENYNILKTGQDKFTRSKFARFFNVKTDSVKAFEKLEKHHIARINWEEAKNIAP